MRKAYNLLPSPDTNFIREFQTTGFDARVWELYLASYFNEVCDKIEQPHDQPDFLLHVGNESTWVEATTANPTQGAPATDTSVSHWDCHNQVALKLGSSLWSKVSKRYWELEHVAGRSFVLAVADFHDANSARPSATPLAEYLYGLHAALGDKGYDMRPIERVTLGTKVIPAPFFDQPDTENVSAVLFSNAGTHAKFSRMGFDPTVYKTLRFVRRGFCYSPDQVLADPFAYLVGDQQEVWGQEVHVFHNPSATIPLPGAFFPDVVHHRMDEEQQLSITVKEFMPLVSQTTCFRFGARDPKKFEEALREGCAKWVQRMRTLGPTFESKIREMHQEWEP